MNRKSDGANEDGTALIHCKCGAMIMVTDIPIPLPRHIRVRCKECGTTNDLDSDDFASLRIDE